MISDLTTNLLQFTRHEIGSTTKSLYSLKDMNEKNMNATNTTELQILLSPTFLAVLIVFKCSCFVCGVLGNLSVIIYNLFMNNNKTPTSYLITNLAFADLLTCLSVYPIWVTEFIMMLSRKHSNQYQVFLCKFTNSVNLVLVSISSLTLLSIAFDRYICNISLL